MDRRTLPLLFAILIIASLTALPATAYAQSSPTSSLKSLGIEVPQQSILPNIAAVYHLDFGKLKLLTLGGKWILPVVKGASKYIVQTGYPSLPFKVISVEINGYAKDVHVYVSVSSYRIVKISAPIVPGPTPVRYVPSTKPSTLLNLTKPRIVMNTTVYSLDRFLPGSVVKYMVLHGLHGKTLVLLYVTPVLYNPAKHELVFVKSLSIVVSYGTVEKIKYNPRGLLIITNSTLAKYVDEYLVPIYKKLGYQVTLVTTDYIWTHYKPAPPITKYPGFYSFLFSKGVTRYLVPFYLIRYYNYTLALKIIEYLRETLGNYSYVVIVGSARTVPPSFYYFSMLEYRYVGFLDAWIPTDYFYASPDYDLLPNMFVGRIPFDNPSYIELYAKKLEVWYQTLSNRTPLIALAGGYTFGLTYAFGESYLETLVDEGLGKAPVTLFTQLEGQFNPDTVAAILSGQTKAMISFIIAHGDGYGLYEPQLWWPGQELSWETLASSYELLKFKPTNMYQVVMTVACEDAWWDYNLVPLPVPLLPLPVQLMPFWKAVLLSPAGGVAFIDAARVNWDYLWLEILNGTLVAQSYGASGLVGDMLLAYASMIGRASNVTLGQIYWLGMTEYLKTVYPYLGSFALMEMMLYALLGDPTLVLKLPKMPVAQSHIVSVKPVNAATILDFTSPLWGLPFTAPMYLATKPGEVAINASAGCYKVEIYREWTWGVFDGYLSMALMWAQKVGETKFCLNKSGVYVLKLKFSPMVSGYLMLRIIGKNYFYRFYLGALGVKALTAATTEGEKVTIQAYGLDLFGISSKVGIDVGNRIVNTMYVPLSGFITYTITLPYTGTGTHIVGVKLVAPGVGYIPGVPFFAVYGWPGVPGLDNIRVLESLLQTPIEVYGVYPLKIEISVPSSVELNSTVAITVMATVEGKPVSAKLSAYIVTPSGEKVPLRLVEKAPGIYVASFTPKSVGVYTVIVNGSASSSKLYAYATGYAAKSFVAIERLYTMASYVAGTVTKEVSSAKKALSEELSSVATKLSARIGEATSAITAAVMEAAKSVNSSVISAISKSTTAVLSSISSTKTALSTQISGVEKSLSSEISSAVSSITRAISTSTESLKSYMSTEFGSISTELKSISSGISSISSELKTMSSTLTSIKSGVSSIQTTLGQVVSTLGTISNELSSISSEIASAKKALSEEISSVEKTLSSEISSGISKIQNAIASTKSALSAQISSATSELSSKIASVQASLKPLAIAATALSAVCIGLIATTLAIVARKK